MSFNQLGWFTRRIHLRWDSAHINCWAYTFITLDKYFRNPLHGFPSHVGRGPDVNSASLFLWNDTKWLKMFNYESLKMVRRYQIMRRFEFPIFMCFLSFLFHKLFILSFNNWTIYLKLSSFCPFRDLEKIGLKFGLNICALTSADMADFSSNSNF